ncbi:MAG: ribosomal subunit interface protein [Chlamydiae bacterium RIFCSPHIGHO2_12_FULL_27_8]|nr:MAG: ribosomal subunit interface protein [Chlamydiae bacterium RIFCSPHIGHO2_12_FULL_27_8]OGN65578.1 MAG: ribosomal subunit interface protein [Chlamydiae bacterium RIFCSPLOWO2_01_FULL_28_7]
MVNKTNFKTEGYVIDIIGKHLVITDAIQKYVEEKLKKVQRFTNKILDIKVTLGVQKLAHNVSIIMHFMHYTIQVHSTTEDLYAAIDGSFAKLYKLIRKYKDKLKNHHNKDLTTIDMHVHVLQTLDEVEEINDEISKENLKEELKKFEMPKIVDKEKMTVKMLTQDEAVMKLELSGENFLLYKCEEDQKIKLLHKRNDGQLGLLIIE